MSDRRRARTLQEFGQKVRATFSAPRLIEAPYRPRPTDVIIAPFAKSGTTWLQQIFHTLRTRGDMDFDDISRVVPWLEVSPLLGIDCNAPQRAEPRGFKSHLSWDAIPKGARYMVSIRDPRDVLVSMFKFQEGWFIEPGAIDIDDFAAADFLRNPERPYWRHLASWWRHRDDQNVLLLAYERMNADPERAIRQVAAFCGIELDAQLLALTLEHTSLEFMLRHKDRFDDLMLRELSERLADLPPGSDGAKVRAGKVGGYRTVLGESTLQALDAIWETEIESELGFVGYPQMLDALG